MSEVSKGQESGDQPPILLEAEDFLKVRILYEEPDKDGVGLTFANHLVVSSDEHEFYLSFCQVIPPHGDVAAIKKSAQERGGFVAKTVARIAISADRMPSFIGACVESLGKRSARTERQRKSALTEKKQGDGDDDPDLRRDSRQT